MLWHGRWPNRVRQARCRRAPRRPYAGHAWKVNGASRYQTLASLPLLSPGWRGEQRRGRAGARLSTTASPAAGPTAPRCAGERSLPQALRGARRGAGRGAELSRPISGGACPGRNGSHSGAARRCGEARRAHARGRCGERARAHPSPPRAGNDFARTRESSSYRQARRPADGCTPEEAAFLMGSAQT